MAEQVLELIPGVTKFDQFRGVYDGIPVGAAFAITPDGYVYDPEYKINIAHVVKTSGSQPWVYVGRIK